MSRRRSGKSPVNSDSAWSRGSDAMRDAQEESAKKNSTGGNVFRYWLPKDETGEIMILDDQPSEFRWEHAAKGDSGRWDKFYNCVKSTHGDHCPACQSLKKASYYVMYLSVIDFRGYTTKDGKDVEYSRKLMAIKQSTFDRWKKRIDRCIADNGTLRGAVFEISRSNATHSPGTGDDLSFIEMDDAIEVEGSYTQSWVDKDNKEHTTDLAEVLDYATVLPNESESDLRKIFGTEAAPGSREADDDISDDDFDDDDGEPPFDTDDEPDDTPAPTRRGRRGRRG